MTQYQRQNASHKVDGYIKARFPGDTIALVFDQAKAECLSNLRRDLADVESLTLPDFLADTRRKPDPAS